MSQIENEINLLKQQIMILEEQKRMEAEKKETPLKALERILHTKKECPSLLNVAGAKGRKPRDFPMSSEDFTWTLDQNDKAEFLEPIFTMLKTIEERLQVLEQKGKETIIEDILLTL